MKSGKKVEKSGFFVHPALSFLGAGSDGHVNRDELVEVKCLYSGRYRKITPVQEFPLFCYGGSNVTPKQNHDYCFRVMG